MPNGVYAARTTNSILAGRAISGLNMGSSVSAPRPGSGVSAAWDDRTAMWPRTAALCAPIVQCCCKGPWTIAPGETLPLIMDWSRWLASVQGYEMFEVKSAKLWDMGKAPPVAADPDMIKVLTGKVDDPDPPDNSDVAELISLIPPNGTQTLIEVSPDARIGDQFKLDICLTACDGCAGRKITLCDCVVITIQEC